MHSSEKYPGGKAMREKRIAAGFTIDEFAHAVGANPRTVSRWEKGEVLPQARHQRAIATFLARPEVPSSVEIQESDLISKEMLKVVLKARINNIRARDLPYLQRVFEQCQQDNEVAFTPELVIVLLKAAPHSTPS